MSNHCPWACYVAKHTSSNVIPLLNVTLMKTYDSVFSNSLRSWWWWLYDSRLSENIFNWLCFDFNEVQQWSIRKSKLLIGLGILDEALPKIKFRSYFEKYISSTQSQLLRTQWKANDRRFLQFCAVGNLMYTLQAQSNWNVVLLG